MSKQQGDTRDLLPLQQATAKQIDRWVDKSEDWTTPIPNLVFFRREEPTEACACLVEPSVVLVVQGSKQMLVGAETFSYNTSNFLITSLDLPGNTQVLEASPGQPCLGLLLKIDFRTVAELVSQGGLPHPGKPSAGVGMGLGTMTPALMEPINRLVELLNEPDAIPVLAPMIQREIHYRLLLSDQAPRLRQIASVDSQGHRIAKAIDWLKTNYASQLRIEDLAASVQMSAPTFHHHFRQLTAMSPLQYQKTLRLNEAKRLMLNQQLSASSAAFQVGYESASQFSREYNRLFGAPPRRDIEQMRRESGALASG